MKKVKSVNVFFSALYSGCDFVEIDGRRRIADVPNWRARRWNVIEMRELVKSGRLALGKKHKQKREIAG
jgi:hypothetical protein